MKQGDRVFFNKGKQLGTITHVHDNRGLVDIKSCGQWYTVDLKNVKLVPAGWTPRWR